MFYIDKITEARCWLRIHLCCVSGMKIRSSRNDCYLTPASRFLVHLARSPFYPLHATDFLVLFLLSFTNTRVQHAAAFTQVESKEERHADALLSAPVLRAVNSAHVSDGLVILKRSHHQNRKLTGHW